jgi:hypothetical protein
MEKTLAERRREHSVAEKEDSFDFLFLSSFFFLLGGNVAFLLTGSTGYQLSA